MDQLVLVRVTRFPYNSVVSEQYLLVSGGKKVASVAFVIRDSAVGDDAIEVRIGTDEPYEVKDLEEALSNLHQKFGGVDYSVNMVNMTWSQARAIGLAG
ncbi:MAG: hypothetical protein HYW79_00815 [Parcubacteria group bacterium]|nr:hypothetical protein [Parcubacteria group bacterium]